MLRCRCRSRGGGTSRVSSLPPRAACVRIRRETFWMASFCACGHRRDRSPRRVRTWSRRCGLNRRKTSESASAPPLGIISSPHGNKNDCCELRTEYTRTEVQLALQSVPVTVIQKLVASYQKKSPRVGGLEMSL